MKRFISIYFISFSIALLYPFCEIDASHRLNNNSYTYQYINAKQGLSNQRVYSIIQDNKDLVWISTKWGVDCFNGRTIKNYSLFDDKVIQDGHGRVVTLFFDSNDKLWAYTETGRIYHYDRLEDKFILYLDVTQWMNQQVLLNTLYIDEFDNIWLGLKSGLYLYKSNSDVYTVLPNQTINALHYSPYSQTMYIGASEGLYQSKPRQNYSAKALRLDFNVQSLYFDPISRWLWVGTFNDGVKVVDTHMIDRLNVADTREIQSNNQVDYIKNLEGVGLNSLPHLPYRCIVECDSKTLLLGIDGAGVFAINRDLSESWLFLNANQEEDGKLSGNGIYAILKDRSSNLWMGSYSGGVTLANPNRYPYQLIQHEYKNTQSLVDNRVNCIFEDCDGDLWYGTDQGISFYNQSSSIWKHYLRNNVILTLNEDNQGNIWAGGYGTGVYCINKHSGIKRHFTAEKSNTLTTNYIYSIAIDDDDELWFGGMYGRLTRYTPPKKGKEESFNYYNLQLINSITPVNKDTIAIATVNGFYLLDKRTGYFKHHFANANEAGTKSNSFIYSMYFPSSDKVWLATEGGGVNYYDINTEKAITYTTNQGLPSNFVYSIQPDDYNRLWLSTDKGLAYITLSIVDSLAYNESAPLSHAITCVNYLKELEREYNFMAYAKLRNGHFVYGSTSGAVHLNPINFTSHLYEAPLQLATFEVAFPINENRTERQSYINKILSENEEILLSHNENSFYITFIGVNYQYQEDVLYTHYLEGFDETWSNPNIDIGVRYTNIPPGNYTFRVRSISKTGLQLLDEKVQRIYISQPYWNTPYAWIIYFAILCAIGYFVWRFFANRLEKKQFSEKIQFFINTAHDIRTPVTLIMAPLSDISHEDGLSEEGKGYLQLARRNTEKLYHLITQLLDFQKMDTTVQSLQIQECDLKQILIDKISCFQSLCDNKEIKTSLNLPEGDLSIWIDKDKIDKVFDNVLSNAIKYTPHNGKVDITVLQFDKKIDIIIKDTGIGIPRKAQRYIFTNFYRAENAINSKETGSGLGLMLTRRLIKLHKGDITFQSLEGEGSTFILSFKCGNSHFKRYLINQNNSIVKEDKENNYSHLQEVINEPLPQNSISDIKILIVEDNDELRSYLHRMFISSYQIIEKPDGQSAWKYLQDNSVDLVVSDVMMPKMQGDELCKHIKNDFRTSHIPVVLLTAKTEKDAVVEGLESGADDYLTKPFDVDILKLKINGMLRNRQLMREYCLNHSLSSSHDEISSKLKTTSDNRDICLDSLSPLDLAFLEKCRSIILLHLSEEDFGIVNLCRELAMSRTLFYEKLKALTGQAPNEFIRLLRLHKAEQLLKEGMPVQEVALLVGFSDSKYFSTAFKKHFGFSPSKLHQ